MPNRWRTAALAPLAAAAVFSAERLLSPGEPAERGPGVPSDSRGNAALRSGLDQALPSAPGAAAERAAAPAPAVPAPAVPEATLEAAPGAAATAERADAKADELLAMSESYRATTLLIAIQSTGYACRDATAIEPAGADLPAWRVECADGLAYWVGVDAAGRVAVEPTYFGGVPEPFGQLPESSPEQRPSLPEQQLAPPRR